MSTTPLPAHAFGGPRQQLTALGVTLLACLSLTFSGFGAAPQLLGTSSLDGQTVALCFDADLDATSAATAGIFQIAGASVQSARLLDNQRTVLLSVAGLSGSSYTLSTTGLTDAQGATADVSGTGAILGWAVQDWGELPAPSTVYACSPSSLNVEITGGTVWFNSDSGNLVSQTRSGDFDVRVQVSEVSGGGPNSNMILDARETADPGSRHVAITVYPTQMNWTSFRRMETDGDSSVLDGDWRIGWPAGIDFPNAWLRLKRSGNTFTTYGSTNGLDWVQIGDPFTPDPPYGDNVVLGLATGVTDADVPPLHVQYSNFGAFAVTNAQIVINSQPQSLTVEENRPAVFTVDAVLQNGPSGALSFQWQRDGVDIPGEAGASYTLAHPTLADQGAQFRVRVSAPGGIFVDSAVAMLTVQEDTTAPSVVSTAGLPGASIGLFFDERLDAATAADPSRYSLTSGAAVIGAQLLDDQQTVVLEIPELTGASYSLQINGVEDLAGNALNTTVTGPVLDFIAQDLGNLPSPSLVYAIDASALGAQVSGGAFWFNSDSGNLISQTRSGDFDVRVQVSEVSGGSPNSNMILDARETADPGSRHVAITVYPTQMNWTSFRRMETEGSSSVLDGDWRIGWPAGIDFPNAWLRLKRSGNTFTTYGSTNGLDWVQIGDPFTPDPPYGDNVVLGLATGVTDADVPPLHVQYSNFGAFAVTNAQIVINSQPQSLTVEENRPAVFTVDAVLQNGPSGALSFQWQRDGVDIPGEAGASYTLARPTLADQGAQFRVRLSAPGVTSVDSAAAFLTVQADTTPPHAVSAFGLVPTMITICFDEALDPISATDPSHYNFDGGAVVLSAELQANGEAVVLNVTELAGNQFTVTLSGLTDLKGNAASGSVTGSTGGFTFLDVGDVAAPGIVFGCSSNRTQVLARGADIWGFNDSFNFLYQEIEGDFDVRLRMENVSLVNAATRGGLMVREDASPGSRNVYVGTYPANGDNHWVATARTTPDGDTIILPGGYVTRDASFAFPNAWVRLKRVGQTFTTHYGSNGLDWVQLGESFTVDSAYPDTVMLGIASSSIDNAGNVGNSYAAFEYSQYGPSATETPSPRLTVSSAGQTVVIAWPASAAGFQLQQSPQLGTGAAWTAVSTAPVVSGDVNEVTVTPGPGALFYRLAR